MRAGALALLLLVAACVESDPSTVEVGPVTTTTAAAPAPQPGAAPTSAPPRTIVVGGTDAVPDAAVPSPRPQQPDGGPGSGAGWFLQADGATQLVVQVLTQRGAEPRQATIDKVEAVLAEASGKPVTTIGGTVDAQRDVWSDDDLRQAADASAPRLAEGTGLLRILFVHGRAAEDGVLGVAFGGDAAAVFSDQVDGAATGLVSPAAIERAVTTHELGHLLGLVDLWLDTGRADPEHPGHSSSRRSVMYWAVESDVLGDLLTGGPPQDFDERDRADLEAIRRG